MPTSGFHFEPDLDAILPVDESWLVDPRVLVKRLDPASERPFAEAYAAAVDELAALGYGCAPDPTAGDGTPQSLVATCIVYATGAYEHVRVPDAQRELHLRLVCTMARTDGAFVGSELAVALEVADRLAGPNVGLKLRFRAIVRELFMNPSTERDPLVQLASMPRPQALHIAETLAAMAWADGFVRLAEQRMLARVHEVLELPFDLEPTALGNVHYADDDAA